MKGIIRVYRSSQYEILTGKPGLSELMDAQSMGHLWIIILVILGNIGYRLKM